MRQLERFPKLYKKSPTTGKMLEWEIWVEGSVIHTSSSSGGSKPKTSKDVIKSGKNKGRSNETTKEEQAYNEAKSKWNKQIDSGYYEEGKKSSKTTARPMLAHEFSKHGHKMKFPVYGQPKLDGTRALYQNGKFLSRRGKPLAKMSELGREVEALFGKKKIPDGELYIHNKKGVEFEKIVSAARNNKSNPQSRYLEYHVYDIVDPERTFAGRRGLIKEAFEERGQEDGRVKRVNTVLLQDMEDVETFFKVCRKRGYEGAMLRDPHSMYENGRRSYSLQKYKSEDDSEFRIVGVEEGRGALAGHVGKFVLQINDEHGKRTFKCSLTGKGVRAFLKKAHTNQKLWKGKWMQVKFMGMTGANKVPRHPRGIKIREVE